MKRTTKGLIAAGLLLACLAAGRLWPDSAAPAFARMEEQTLIIDPGHGGEDGGAVSVSGQPESNINLAIARDLDQLMGFYGVRTILTRQEDISIHDDTARTLREKKVSDLHNRVALINSVGHGTLISINQNAAPDPGYHGAQVFYADDTLSPPLARQIQTTIGERLDPENTRSPQHIPDSVYLMNHITCRAVLVECGFLSNAREDRLLQQSDYQRKLAMVLASGYLRCGSAQEGEDLV